MSRRRTKEQLRHHVPFLLYSIPQGDVMYTAAARWRSRRLVLHHGWIKLSKVYLSCLPLIHHFINKLSVQNLLIEGGTQISMLASSGWYGHGDGSEVFFISVRMWFGAVSTIFEMSSFDFHEPISFLDFPTLNLSYAGYRVWQ